MLFNLFFAIIFFSSRAAAENSCPLLSATNQESHIEITEDKLSDIFTQSKGCLTVVEIWASWCGPCVQIAPQVAAFQEKHPEVLFLSVSADATKAKASQFWKQHDHRSKKWRLTAWSTEGLAKEYQTLGLQFPGRIPYFIVLDPSGKVILELTEPKDLQALEKTLATHRK